ncbi:MULTISPECIES: metallophosphoesterase family protein [Bacillus]|uniref:Phosphoesterase n=2 Tax=Bacillus TaxID=1386 RepID=A0A0M4G9B3_9BACI|nr:MULTISPECIES: metallophosphoesterase [Bacillus]ALC81940.1 metallophosphatase [Bacillus gobiensis]MBP1083270.1 putative phosphoesterase [Bacillus capparidis]MED1097707.1 metallophosphoesterase [Bacillus capparidis]
MNILIISDSHGDEEILKIISERHKDDVDLMLHCGDSELSPTHPYLKPYLVVKGNCDFEKGFEKERVMPIEDKKLYFTHGHLHGIKESLMKINYRAQELGADVICFGHSHNPGSELFDGRLFINPGSILLPRMRKERSYAILSYRENSAAVHFYDENGHEIKDLRNNFQLE